MEERIIYCSNEQLTWLENISFTRIGEWEGGAWIAVGDDVIAHMANVHAYPSLVYFGREEYERAVRDLSPEQVKEVVAKRLKQWTPQALDQSTDRLYQGQKQCLAYSAAAGSEYDEHFARSIGTLDKIIGDERYADTPLAKITLYTLEAESHLIKETELAEAVNTEFNDEARKRREYAHQLGKMLKQLGIPGYDENPPFANIQRAVFVSPADPDFIRELKARQLSYIEWNNGLALECPVRKIPALEERGKTVTTLYMNSGQLTDDTTDLTIAQREREFTQRLNNPPDVSYHPVVEYFCELSVKQILLKRIVQKKAHEEKHDMARWLDPHIEEEIDNLRSRLQKTAIWTRESPDASEDRVMQLKNCEKNIHNDISFFLMSARCLGDEKLQLRFGKLMEIKEQDLKNLGLSVGGSKQ